MVDDRAGRVRDRQELIRAATTIGEAAGATVVLGGPPGIGKTFVLGDLASRAADAAHRVVTVRAHEAERHLPFAGLATLCGRLTDDGFHLRLDPARRELLDDATSGTHPVGHELAVGSAVLALLGAVVGVGPTLLLVDDVQWLDPPTLQALLFALRRLRDDPILTVLATTDAASMPREFPVVELDGVDLDTATSMLSERAPVVDEVARRCWEATGGNPLALRELTRHLDARHLSGVTPIPWARVLPTRLVDAYTEQIAPLDDDVRDALLVLALASGASIDTGLRALGLDRRQLRPAVDAGLVTDDARPTFTHSTCAAAVIAAAPADRVRSIHATMARAVSDDEAAWHASAAADGPDDTAAERLADAGRRARARGMPTAAAAAFERAAELVAASEDRQRHALDAATSWWYAGRPERVVAVLDPLLRDATVVADVRASMAVRIGTARSWLGSPRRAGRDMLDDAIAIARQDPAGATRLLYAATASAAQAADFRTAATGAEHAARLTDATADPIGAAIASAIRGFVTLVRGDATSDDVDVATLFGLTRLPIERLADEQLDLFQFVVFGLYVAGRLDDAARLTDDLRRTARDRGLVSLMVFASGLLGEIERRRGDWGMAERWASDVSTTLSIEPFSHAEFGDVVCARIWAHQGRDVHQLLAPLIAEAHRRELGHVHAAAQAALLASDVARGDLDGAWRHLDLVDRDVRRAGGLDPGVLWTDLDALDVMLALGRYADAARLVRDRRRTSSSPSGSWSAAIAHLGRCLLVGHGHLTGEPTQGSPTPAEIVAAFGALGAPFEAARAGLMLAEAGLVPPDDRHTAVRSALDTFRRLGAEPWERRAARLLDDAAVGPDTGTDPWPDADATPTGDRTRAGEPDGAGPFERLTSAELRVGLTVANGCSNAEAAAELYLSQRTVEAHLRAIFRKLGVRNRTEMAMRLRGTSLPK